MSGKTTAPTALEQLSTDLSRDAARLDTGCRTTLGVSALMFRTAKYVFYIATLAFSGILLHFGVEPSFVMLFAALLITGPEGVETWLMAQGTLPERDESDRGE